MAGTQDDQQAIISEEILGKLRSRIGAKHRLKDVFNELACKDAIRKFADGIGDSNPLWRDEEYARRTRYGGIVAPPSWLYSVFIGWDPLDVPAGISLIPAGHDWEFYKPVLVGDTISIDRKYTDLDIKRGGAMVIEGQELVYHNQKGEVVAKARSLRISMKNLAGQVAKSQQEFPYPWTEAELARIEEEVLGEQVRGDNTRYWEDTNEGEELPPAVKGPLGLADMVAYLIGAAPVRVTAHGSTLRLLREHPWFAARDPETFSPERRDTSHFNRALAEATGAKSGFCYGGQNHCWVIHVLTNWMGDDGWLKKSRVQYRGIISFSDVVWCGGKVIKKFVDEDGEHCVDIETSVVNQRGNNIVPGHSTIVLPSKEKKVCPLDRRLPSDRAC